MSDNFRPVRRKTGLTARSTGTDTVVYDSESDVVHALPAELARVWRACGEGRALPAIAAAAGVSDETAARCIARLDELTLLEPMSGGFDRRRFLQRGGLVGAGALGVSLLAPMAAHALSNGTAAATPPYDLYTTYAGVTPANGSTQANGPFDLYDAAGSPTAPFPTTVPTPTAGLGTTVTALAYSTTNARYQRPTGTSPAVYVSPAATTTNQLASSINNNGNRASLLVTFQVPANVGVASGLTLAASTTGLRTTATVYLADTSGTVVASVAGKGTGNAANVSYTFPTVATGQTYYVFVTDTVTTPVTFTIDVNAR